MAGDGAFFLSSFLAERRAIECLCLARAAHRKNRLLTSLIPGEFARLGFLASSRLFSPLLASSRLFSPRPVSFHFSLPLHVCLGLLLSRAKLDNYVIVLYNFFEDSLLRHVFHYTTSVQLTNSPSNIRLKAFNRQPRYNLFMFNRKK
jgi:hypothetical protein